MLTSLNKGSKLKRAHSIYVPVYNPIKILKVSKLLQYHLVKTVNCRIEMWGIQRKISRKYLIWNKRKSVPSSIESGSYNCTTKYLGQTKFLNDDHEPSLHDMTQGPR